MGYTVCSGLHASDKGLQTPKLNISDGDFRALIRKPFDPLWVQMHSINPGILDSFYSNQTLERMVVNNVIRQGDEIYYIGTYETVQGLTQVEKIARVRFQETRDIQAHLLKICMYRSQACRKPTDVSMHLPAYSVTESTRWT